MKLWMMCGLAVCMLLTACGGGGKKTEDEVTTDAILSKIDTANLKTEAAILDALQKVHDSKLAAAKASRLNTDYQVLLSAYRLAISNAYGNYLPALPTVEASKAFTEKYDAIDAKIDIISGNANGE